MNSSPPGSWPPPQGGWAPRPPQSDANDWSGTPSGPSNWSGNPSGPSDWSGATPAGTAYPPQETSDERINTTGATLSLALGIVSFIVALLAMTIGTVLVVTNLISSDLYLFFILLSAAGAVGGIMSIVLAALFRAQLRRRGSAEARGRALGGLIMGILAIPSPLMGFFLGAVAVGLAGH